MLRKLVRRGLVGLGVLLLAAQVVPYGRRHTNPPVRREPNWDQPQTRALAKRACFDCHSNETTWPWYSHVAPMSWLVQRDVDQGRKHLNFTEWDRPQQETDDVGEVVGEGEMPPWFYLPLHPEARLAAEERAALARGLEATTGGVRERHKRKGKN